mgnify:CR=1 FL=1
MGFKNPIPDIDDVREAKRFIISPVFTYEQEMTLEEAAEILCFVQTLEEENQNDFFQFLQGVRYGLNLANAKKKAEAAKLA